jgi:hypothetical protein
MLNEYVSFNGKASDRSTEPWHLAPTLCLDACQLYRIIEKDLKLEFSEEARRHMDKPHDPRGNGGVKAFDDDTRQRTQRPPSLTDKKR